MSVNKRSLAVISSSSDNVEVFGITDDKTGLGRISFNGSDWSPWSVLGLTNGLLYKSAPSAISTQLGSFDVFATDTGDNLMTRHFNGTSWRPDIGWQHMTGNIADAGNALAMAPAWGRPTERYDLNTRETDGFVLTLYNIEEDPERFGIAFFREYAKAPPITIHSGPLSMDLFFIDMDDYIHHFHFIYDPYPRWDDGRILGDENFISPPTPVSIAEGRVDIFGIAPDQTVMYNTYQSSNNKWTGWKQLGSRRFVSSISAVVPKGTNHIELWGLGLDGALWHRGYDGTHWPVDWDSHKGRFISAPAVISPSVGVYDVFAIGTDGALKHARHIETPDSWKPAYRGWNSLGGSLMGF